VRAKKARSDPANRFLDHDYLHLGATPPGCSASRGLAVLHGKTRRGGWSSI
jgi:hypothetical protein